MSVTFVCCATPLSRARLASGAAAWRSGACVAQVARPVRVAAAARRRRGAVRATKETPGAAGEESADEVFTSKSEGGKTEKLSQAGELLKRYGSAYLVTSITFAIISYALCYVLVDSGVDVAALLAKVGLQVNQTSEQVGTAALAYAIHKAASPIRFPPTVVAKWLGKEDSSS